MALETETEIKKPKKKNLRLWGHFTFLNHLFALALKSYFAERQPYTYDNVGKSQNTNENKLPLSCRNF